MLIYRLFLFLFHHRHNALWCFAPKLIRFPVCVCCCWDQCSHNVLFIDARLSKWDYFSCCLFKQLHLACEVCSYFNNFREFLYTLLTIGLLLFLLVVCLFCATYTPKLINKHNPLKQCFRLKTSGNSCYGYGRSVVRYIFEGNSI